MVPSCGRGADVGTTMSVGHWVWAADSDWDMRLWVWHGVRQLLLVKGDIQEKGQL